MTDDELNKAFRGYFAREMAGLATTAATRDSPVRGQRRSLATLAVAVALGLALALALLPTPAGPRGVGPGAGTDFLRDASADGSRLRPPTATPKPAPPGDVSP